MLGRKPEKERAQKGQGDQACKTGRKKQAGEMKGRE